MKITYRKAEAADLDEIQAFVDQAKIVMEKQGIPQWDEVYPILADFDGDLKAGNLFVGVAEGGNLAVTFTISMEQDEAYKDGKWAYAGEYFRVIHRLCVNPQFQNMGLGGKTCKYIEETLREQGGKAIRLDTFTLNPYSCALYIIITGASHTEKTLLAQRLLEK